MFLKKPWKKPFGKNPSPTSHSSTQRLPSTQVSAKFPTSAPPSTSYTTVLLTMQLAECQGTKRGLQSAGSPTGRGGKQCWPEQHLLGQAAGLVWPQMQWAFAESWILMLCGGQRSQGDLLQALASWIPAGAELVCLLEGKSLAPIKAKVRLGDLPNSTFEIHS